jgi:DNA processing protein
VHTFFRLMREHGSAAAVLAALPGLAARAGVRDYTVASVEETRAEQQAARRFGALLVCFGDAEYPPLLARIDDPPPLFWAKGDLSLLTRPAVALVGARNASSLGERMARQLAQELGRAGLVTVSGLARGIDAAAHDASLKTGTIAVQGGGIDLPYPAENDALFRRIGEVGCLISEQPMGLAPQARHFPRRNRIISGIARALVVVEAAARSGSLITARNALDQGREVLAVPGHPFDARATGCNMLIRDGATLVRSAADILEAVGPFDLPAGATAAPTSHGRDISPRPSPSGPEPAAPSPAAAGSHHARILARLGPTPLAEDQLIRDLKLPAAQVAPALLDLELDGRILRHAGGLVSLA